MNCNVSPYVEEAFRRVRDPLYGALSARLRIERLFGIGKNPCHRNGAEDLLNPKNFATI